MTKQGCLHPTCFRQSHRLFCAIHDSLNGLPRISLYNGLYKYLDQRTVELLAVHFPPRDGIVAWRQSHYPDSTSEFLVKPTGGQYPLAITIDYQLLGYNLPEKIIATCSSRRQMVAIGLSGTVYYGVKGQNYRVITLTTPAVKARVDYGGEIFILDEQMRVLKIVVGLESYTVIHLFQSLQVRDFETVPWSNALILVTQDHLVYNGVVLDNQKGGCFLVDQLPQSLRRMEVSSETSQIKLTLVDGTYRTYQFQIHLRLNSRDIII